MKKKTKKVSITDLKNMSKKQLLKIIEDKVNEINIKIKQIQGE